MMVVSYREERRIGEMENGYRVLRPGSGAAG